MDGRMKIFAVMRKGMAMTDDTIYRQVAIDTINELHDKPNAWLDLAVDALENLPSAEPEIIRCRECKYSHLTYDGDCKQCDQWLDDDDFQLTLYLDGDFYCGFAERRTDEQDD